jgi:hypothetical protein
VTVGEFAQLITAIVVAGNFVVSLINGRKTDRNSQKLDEVHKTTNSLAQRNEAIARQLGIAEGKQSQKENPT